MRQAVARILDRAGFVALATGDLHEAARWVRNDEPDLLLANVYVPASSGRDAALQFKALSKDAKAKGLRASPTRSRS